MLSVVHGSHVEAGVAVLMAVRDLGNGVVRLEGARLARGLAEAGESWMPVGWPLGVAVADCLGIAAGWLGVRGEPSAGSCRCVTDRLTEYCVW